MLQQRQPRAREKRGGKVPSRSHLERVKHRTVANAQRQRLANHRGLKAERGFWHKHRIIDMELKRRLLVFMRAVLMRAVEAKSGSVKDAIEWAQRVSQIPDVMDRQQLALCRLMLQVPPLALCYKCRRSPYATSAAPRAATRLMLQIPERTTIRHKHETEPSVRQGSG